MLRIFYMQATGYAGGHEYMDYCEVVAVLDDWGERFYAANLRGPSSFWQGFRHQGPERDTGHPACLKNHSVSLPK